MMETLDEAIARHASVKKVVAEECCPECWASGGLHEITCPRVQPPKRKTKKERVSDK